MFKMLNKSFKSTRSKVMAAYAFLTLTLPVKVMAALPTADTVADGASTTSPIQLFRDMGERGVTIGATVIGGLVAAGIAVALYTSFNEAREKNDWKRFGITAAAGVVVAASTVILALLAIEYATPA